MSISISKSGNTNIFNNYKPISIPPARSKIIDTFLCNRLLNYWEKYNILYKHQYGFFCKHSTTHPILYLLKSITDRNDKILHWLYSFLDLSKTFDTIDIQRYQLYHYRTGGISNK